MSENTKTQVSQRRCECGLWETREGTSLTGCTSVVTSKRDFRPGHDAKLKGAMIRAKHAQTEVGRRQTGGTVAVWSDAVTATLGFGFGHLVASATPRTKAPRKTATTKTDLAAIVAKAEDEEIAHDEATVAAAVRKIAPVRKPRRS